MPYIISPLFGPPHKKEKHYQIKTRLKGGLLFQHDKIDIFAKFEIIRREIFYEKLAWKEMTSEADCKLGSSSGGDAGVENREELEKDTWD